MGPIKNIIEKDTLLILKGKAIILQKIIRADYQNLIKSTPISTSRKPQRKKWNIVVAVMEASVWGVKQPMPRANLTKKLILPSGTRQLQLMWIRN